MRINNPKLFNGDLLATKKNIASWLGLTLDSQQANVTGQITAGLIPISGIGIEDGQYPIYANKIAMGADNAQTISAAIAALQQNVQNVKVYDVDNAGAITVTPSTWTEAGVPQAKFTVGLSIDADSLTQENDTLAVKDSFITDTVTGNLILNRYTDGIASGNAAEYKLMYNGKQLGETINIPKDQFLSGVTYDSATQTLNFAFILPDGPSITPVNIGSLVDTYYGASGVTKVTVDNKDTFIGVVDPASDSRYFSVGDDGFKLAGVADDIDYLSGQVSGVIEQVTSTDKFVSAATIDITASGKEDTLYYTLNGQTAIYDNGDWRTISMEALTEITAATANNTTTATSLAIKNYVDGVVGEVSGILTGDIKYVSSAVTGVIADLESVSGTLEDEIQFVSGAIDDVSGAVDDVSGAVDYVSGVVSGAVEDIETISTEILPYKAEIYVTSGTFGGTGTTSAATVDGRVIAVYATIDGNGAKAGDQVYPEINYAGTQSTLTATDINAPETFTIVYVAATEKQI